MSSRVPLLVTRGVVFCLRVHPPNFVSPELLYVSKMSQFTYNLEFQVFPEKKDFFSLEKCYKVFFKV